MSRKDYVRIAAIIAAERSVYRDTEGWSAVERTTRNLAYSIADAFAQDNPRFDRDRFYAACGMGY